MSRPLRNAARLAAAGLACLAAAPAQSQQQIVKPPIAHYWLDAATHTMAGMPEMPGMPALPFMGGGSSANSYGNARYGMSPGRWLDLALHTRARPQGTEASHAIPPGMQMGANLVLLPIAPNAPAPRTPGEDGAEAPLREKPTGRILLYWGCGEAVRAGQPRVIDLANANPAELGRAMGGRFAPDRGARIAPGYSTWPNEKHRTMVPRDASLVGEHAVSGDGVPASLRFALSQAQDFIPPIRLAGTGGLADSIALQWQPLPTARAFYLHAMGSIGKDLVLWSSAETPDTGMGLFDYLSNTDVDRWLRERVLLPAAQTQCAVPKGIFAGGTEGGAMLRMIAYGSELNLVHPPRPSDPRKAWEQEWSARLRVKSTTMAMLGMDMDAAASGRGSTGADPARGQEQEEQGQAAQERSAPIPGLPGIPGAGKAMDAIRGIFGR